MNTDKQWLQYCRALNVNPRDKGIIESSYYQRGFAEWKRLQREFTYFDYMSKNV
ncbi:hypothetical protein VP193E371_P0151 [Vibrio phage 193E37-1]|nr:hypothetical protein VP193E371_P0151 [Vibrio phage 193E37-1]